MADYLIWSNQHRLWWRPNSAGYTTDLASAGRYSRETAISVCAHGRDGWKPGEAPSEIPVLASDAWEALTIATAEQARAVGDQFKKIVGGD